MNTVITEISEKAKESVPKGILAPDLWIQEYNRIFAELIVRECAEVVQEGRWMVPPSQEQLARSIKQHFGVGE